MSGLLLWIGVGVLGGLGGLARVLVDVRVSRSFGARFPTGILAVNVSGSLLLGLVVGLGVRGDAALLAGTAVLGSYTTFSTWMLESERLAAQGRERALVLNVVGSLLLGVTAAALGRALGSWL